MIQKAIESLKTYKSELSSSESHENGANTRTKLSWHLKISSYGVGCDL